jgi:hypothetical protein
MQTNAVIEGSTSNITNMRVQESYGSNLWVAGNGNTFGDTHMDDTGCIAPHHGVGTSNLPPVRAALVLDAWSSNDTCKDNRFNDVGIGPAVHPGYDYATHAVFCLGRLQSDDDEIMPTNNTGRIYTKSISSYYTSNTTGKTPMGKTPGVNHPWGSNFDASATLDNPTPGVAEGMCERSWYYSGVGSPTSGGENKAAISVAIPTSNTLDIDGTALHAA